MQYIYTMNGVSKTVPPKRQIIKDISLSFFPGAKIGLLGLNGAGKSTVLRIMAGVDKRLHRRSASAAGHQGRLPGTGATPRPGTDRAPGGGRRRGRSDERSGRTRQGLRGLCRRRRRFRCKLAKEQERLEAILAAGDAAHAEAATGSGGRRAAPAAVGRVDQATSPVARSAASRCAACCCRKPDMLLLDEPTNHLDAESVEWLEQFLARFPGTVVAVTHDRYFLDNAAEWILELDRGRGIPWKGNYTEWLMQKDERLRQEENQEKARQKAIQKELEWARQNAKGGRSKGKARLAKIEELQSVDYQKRNETNEIFIPPGERLGQSVIEFKGVSKSFGDRLLIDDLSFVVPPGAIVGIIGPNGAGKSTLFKMLMGIEKPDKGEIASVRR
jgi:sulfate-transporting ATPase